MLSMLAMAAMVSCTNEIESPDQPKMNENDPVEIKATAGVGGVSTKAAIDQDGTSGALNNDLAGVYFLREDATTASWSNLGTPIEATILKNGSIKFNTGSEQYYTKDGGNSHLFGYYPTVTTKEATILKWTITGKEDIIISDVQSGNKSKTDALSFKFSHQLTQLQFTIKSNTAITGEKIQSVSVKFQKAAAQYSPSTSVFEFTGAADNALTSDDANKTDDITTAGVSGGTLLLEPSQASKDFDIEVKTVTGSDIKTYTGKVNIGAAVNTAYKVTLTISQQEVSGSATIGKWTDGAEASGNII